MRGRLLLSLLFLASCVSNPAYPPEWPDFSGDRYEDCPKISGMYSDEVYEALAPYAEDPRHPPHSNLSRGLPLGYMDKTRILVKPKVKIVQSPGGELEFSLLDDETVVIKKTYSKQAGDFYCNGTELKFWSWGGLGTVGLGLGWGETTFRKAVDGSLVVKSQGRVAGLIFLVFPIVVLNERQWYLYKEARSSLAE